MAKYKRVLIKLSGEALGDHGRLFDFEQIDRVADVIRQLHETGAEIAIVIGAGNIWRGRQGPAAKMTAVNADHMGMLGTAINSIAMQDAVERQGIASRVMQRGGNDALLRAVYLSPGCASSGKGTCGHLCLRHGQSVLLHRYGGGVARG